MPTLGELIIKIPEAPAPRALKTRILARISEAAERSMRLHRVLFGVLSFASAALIIPSVLFAIYEFSQSAFASYFSLIFTDGDVALANWKTLLLSLLESAPMVGLTLALAALLALLASMRGLVRYMHGTRMSHAIS